MPSSPPQEKGIIAFTSLLNICLHPSYSFSVLQLQLPLYLSVSCPFPLSDDELLQAYMVILSSTTVLGT